uniref:Abhydrolase domain containing 14A n=1 Tax=Sphenodon punctatus TaxID=8508 RepID=A0A8D0L0Q4_SPHPU
MSMTLIRNRLGLLVLGVLVTFVLYLLLPAIQHEKFTSSIDIPKPRAMEEEEEKGRGDLNTTILMGKIPGNPPVFYREALSLQKPATPISDLVFNQVSWTLSLCCLVHSNLHSCCSSGYGDSPQAEAVETVEGRVTFLQHVLKELALQKPVLVSSSMSGRYSIPFLLKYWIQLKGFVPIAPVGTKEYTTQQYQEVQTPTLIVYGEKDTHLGTQSLQNLKQIPKHRVVMLSGAGHACYLDKPREFHEALLHFLGELK